MCVCLAVCVCVCVCVCLLKTEWESRHMSRSVTTRRSSTVSQYIVSEEREREREGGRQLVWF